MFAAFSIGFWPPIALLVEFEDIRCHLSIGVSEIDNSLVVWQQFVMPPFVVALYQVCFRAEFIDEPGDFSVIAAPVHDIPDEYQVITGFISGTLQSLFQFWVIAMHIADNENAAGLSHPFMPLHRQQLPQWFPLHYPYHP